jgi:outer membrane protein
MKKLIFALLLSVVIAFTGKAQKFGFVDTQYILENITEYRDAQDKLDKISVDWQKEIEAKFAEVDKMYKDFQTEAPLLPEDLKKQKQDAITQKEKEAKELQKKRFGKDGDLFKKRQELIKPIQDKVYEAVEELANAQGLAIIFDKAGSVTLLYANSKFDKSDEVLEKLGYKPGTLPAKDKTDGQENKNENNQNNQKNQNNLNNQKNQKDPKE